MLTPIKPVKSCECGSPCGDCCGCTKESIGLGNVDNTSDLNKPLSTAMINALSGKVDLDTFTQLKNRVLALENSMPDITDLEHRMDEAEDDILGLNAGYNSLHNTVLSMADSITELGGRVTGVSDGLVTVGTRVDALEDEDSNNMKLNRSQTAIGDNTFRGRLKAKGQPAYSPSQSNDDVATIGTLDAYSPMVRTTGNQEIGGTKTLTKCAKGICNIFHSVNITPQDQGWRKIMSFDNAGATNLDIELSIIGPGNGRFAKANIYAYLTTNTATAYIYGYGSTSASANTRIKDGTRLVYDGTKVYLMVNGTQYDRFNVSVLSYFSTVGRYEDMINRCHGLSNNVEPEPTTDTYTWVVTPQLIREIQ